MKKILFNECPRVQFVRKNYTLLDGKWDFYLDFDNKGIDNHFENGFNKTHDIIVPFAYQCPASGINIQKRCDEVWYQKKINLKKDDNKEIILHLEGSDYLTRVYLNGLLVGEEEGAYHRESFNLSPFVKDGENLLVIHCHDDYDKEKPRGKQRFKDESYECYYIDTTGIWKSVWIEEVPIKHLSSIKITPDVSTSSVSFIPTIKGATSGLLKIDISFEGQNIVQKEINIEDEKEFTINIPSPIKLWDLDEGNLYDIEFSFYDDEVSSYFAFKDLINKDGKFYLNGKPLFQKLVLDQGYYLNGHLTQDNLMVLYNDIIKMKQYGFNGCRKHQKIEDERFLYYADVLGYLVWVEMPSPFAFTKLMEDRFFKEWKKVVKDQYNHPSVITWVLFNESWGVFDIKENKSTQQFVNEVYDWTKSYDKNRFVISNDGWHHTKSDILTIHHYEQDGDKLHEYFIDKQNVVSGKTWTNHIKGAFADGYYYEGQPIMIDEFAGTAYKESAINGNWGYGTQVNGNEEYVHRLKKLFNGLNTIDYLTGYCFTQLSDVQQEVNGLLKESREDKIDPSLIKQIQNR